MKKIVIIVAMLSSLAVIRGDAQLWTQLTPTTAITPTPRYNASGIYDESGNNLVIFGGRNSSGNLNEVWSFNLDTLVWVNITPTDTNQPAKRFAHTAVYDRPSRRMIIWSGQGNGFYNDLWAFDLSSHIWQQMMPGGVLPNPRYGSAAIYEPINRRMLIFSGFTDVGRYGDTRAYDIDSDAWIDFTSTGMNPLARCLHTASYDSVRKRMIIYGGQRTGPLDDIWAFDLASKAWMNLTTATRPLGRIFPSSVYADDKILVFGGQTIIGSVNELWSFGLSDTAWTLLSPSGVIPDRRNSHTVIYVAQQHAMIVFGGIGDSVYNDVWKLSDIPTEVGELNTTPEAFHLYQNYPNPFNPTTIVRYQLPIESRVSIRIYDLRGELVITLVDEEQQAGYRSVEFNASNLPSGVYFYRLEASSTTYPMKIFSQVKKILLVK